MASNIDIIMPVDGGRRDVREVLSQNHFCGGEKLTSKMRVRNDYTTNQRWRRCLILRIDYFHNWGSTS
jgi:hypothetical protein